ncbi:Condensation domain-containing protein [Micromonospora citrea]|uniref:Condensation domain-containing protein n=1 Tax=Micromonospora citrea TaxID=47855 RepID=A0A1C6TRM6_9ACTN|nr:condensation domain-containing protein [Micromonospora citrea]SCL44452.1 Condensation domain-containing protein [Micromonospora citrea]
MHGQGGYPLTMGQRSMWRALSVRPPEQLWESNQDLVWSLPAGTAAEQVRQALTALAARHESLRTVYRPADEPDAVRQVVLRDPPVRFTEASVREPFDLAAQPAWRAWLHSPDDGGSPQLRLVIHHLAADGAAVRILESDLRALLRGDRLADAPTPRKVAERQRADEFRARLIAAGEYRRRTIAAAPRVPVSRGSLVRARAHTGIPYGVVRDAARRLRITVPTLLLTVYAQALAATTGRTDQLLWQLASNRLDPTVRRLVSSMTQWVPMLAACDPDGPLPPMARGVNVAALRAMQHGVYDPFAVAPMDFDHGSFFTFIPAPADADPEPSEVAPRRVEFLPPRAYSGASFYLMAWVHPCVQFTLRVMRGGYGRAEVERFLTTMTDLLLRAVEEPA